MRVIVIGAGIAGASAARALRLQGHEVEVVEAGEAVGGRTRSITVGPFRPDSGAIFVMGQYERTLAFLKASGRAAQMQRWKAPTAVLTEDGRFHRVRFDQPWTLLRLPQLSWAARARIVRRLARLVVTRGPGPFTLEELAAADDGSTLGDWGRRTLGTAGFEFALRPLMGPLTGADPEVISAPFTRALMHQVLRTQLTVPEGGMGAIAEWLMEGTQLRLQTPVRGLRVLEDGVEVHLDDEVLTADAMVLATDVLTAARLLDEGGQAAGSAALRAVVPIRTHHVFFGYLRDPWPTVGHDLVVRAHEGHHPDFGVLLSGRRSPGSAPAGGQCVSVYLDDAQLAGRDALVVAREAVAATFGAAPADVEQVFSHDAGLVAPTPGHYDRMVQLRDQMPPRLRLAGDYLTHSGIEGALRSGERAAADLANVRWA